MKKIVIQEKSSEGLIISIEQEVGMDCYELSLGISSIQVSKEELLIIKLMITEILEN
jgi:hypothetical protein